MAGERAVLMATDPPYLVDYAAATTSDVEQTAESARERTSTGTTTADHDSAVGLLPGVLRVALEARSGREPVIYQWFAMIESRIVGPGGAVGLLPTRSSSGTRAAPGSAE